MTVDAEPALERLRADFRRVLDAGEVESCETGYRFADRPVEVVVAGAELAETLLRPWGHLRGGPGGDPDLRLELWDAGESGVGDERLFLTEDVEQDESAEVSEDGGVVIYRRRETVVALERSEQRIVGMARSTGALTLYELGRPLHAPLLLWYRDRGHPALHAGLVEKDGRGALLVGAGGSGKTTSALRCALDGYRFVSDDYVGLEDDGDRYRGHGLYGSTHVEPSHLRETFPELAPHAIEGSRPGEDKWLVLLTEVCPERLRAAAPIDVVLLPNVGERDSPRLRDASKGDALRRLAPSSLLMLPHARSRDLGRLASLVESVPCLWLDLGRDVDGIPAAVDRALEVAP